MAPDTMAGTEQYIGPRKIEAVVMTDHKTHGGNEVVKVLYSGGYQEIMPKKSFELLVTNKPTDWNDLRDRKLKAILLEVLAVLAEHDFKASDVEALKISLDNELYNSFNRATHYLWTKDDKSFIPGTNTVLERSLLEADIIIKGINNNDDESAAKTEQAATGE